MSKVAHVAFLIVFGAILGGHGAAQAQSSRSTITKQKASTQDGRYGQRDEGWFFYKDPPAPPKDPDQKPKDPKSPGAPPEKKVLSAEWIRDNLPKYRYIAIDNPTKDNVEMYLLLQKLAMDKSEQFALAHRQYASQNPGIDETIQNPTSTISRQSMSDVQEKNQNEVTQKLSKHVGLFYFFRSDCQYCHQQNPMIEVLARMTGMSVTPISLDGMPSQDGRLPNWRPDNGQGEYLGVTKTPTMFMVEPGGKVVLLSVGVRSVPELRNRMIEIAKDEKWIGQEEYDLAMRGLPRKFITEGLDEKELQDDPTKLLAALRAATTHGKTEADYNAMEGAGASQWNGKGAKR